MAMTRISCSGIIRLFTFVSRFVATVGPDAEFGGHFLMSSYERIIEGSRLCALIDRFGFTVRYIAGGGGLVSVETIDIKSLSRPRGCQWNFGLLCGSPKILALTFVKANNDAQAVAPPFTDQGKAFCITGRSDQDV